MTDASKFAPYVRKDYLATVAPERRATAERLCKLLEAAYPRRDIRIYMGFPIVVRDGEWLAGFAMRAKCPVVYACSPHTMAVMGDELRPLLVGKTCLELRARKGVTLEQAFGLVERAFLVSREGPGVISATDRRRREREHAKPAQERSKATKAPRRPARKA